jgi:carbamoyltransferase
VAAAQEERFTRKKHDAAFPAHAARYCLEAGGIDMAGIDLVAYYDKPLLTFERLMETWFAFAPSGFRSFSKALPVWLKEKLFIPKRIDAGLPGYTGPLVFTRHHQSHAASAFYPSPFEDAAILTIDGVGEWSTTTLGHGQGNQMRLLKEIRFPHSLGLLYSAFTYYTGFRVNSGEYKVMGLAPYGVPRFADLVFEKMLDLREDGSFHLDMRYFNYCQGLTMTSPAFHDLFGAPPRKPEEKLTQFHMDIAASVQKVCEIVMLKLAREARRVTGSKNLVMAGGCALNCVANGLIMREKVFDDIFVQPAAGDAGGAIGAALFAWHQIKGNPRTPSPRDSQKGSYLGPRYDTAEIRAFLDGIGAPHTVHNGDLPARVAGLIAQEKVVGLFQGRMEFGPRALGGRSIIGDARSPKMQSVMNLKIKFRESFRPFAPCVLAEKTSEYFEFDKESPYMLMVAPVRPDKRVPPKPGEENLFGIEKLNVPRSVIPAVTHVDYSARLQTVSPERNGLLYRIMAAFNEKTGCPVIINTSFNIRGEPIVCRPEEAYRCFMLTDMDALVLENCVLLKENQPKMEGAEDYRASFQLD